MSHMRHVIVLSFIPQSQRSFHEISMPEAVGLERTSLFKRSRSFSDGCLQLLFEVRDELIVSGVHFAIRKCTV